jgi:ADP-ribosylglycohydrolase
MNNTTGLPQNYRERVYAGWIGKSAGVRFGAPIENWTYKDIKENLGELTGYLPLAPGKIFKPDDDTAFPMVLVRAVRDWAAQLTAEAFAEGMLNYLGDQRGTLWWGGYGVSTEHTAYLNLANGIPASLSGSSRLNGKVMAEQIGGQIFSDIWGMMYPNSPSQAADISQMAQSISHDGEGLIGARYVAALASLAFQFTTARQLVTDALSVIPADSAYAKVVCAMLDFHLDPTKTWRDAYGLILKDFGYDKYPGVVPIVPNAGVIVLALLYGDGDFTRTLCIGNMCGWDTDCNVGNLGAIMGIAVGLDGIAAQWRDPMQDELVLASVVGADNYLDIAQCADRIADCGERFASVASTRSPYRYHFCYPGSTQGFRIGGEAGKIIQLWNNSTGSSEAAGQGPTGLCAVIKKLGKKSYASWYVKTSCRVDELTANYYGASFSPKIYPGQTITATLSLPEGQPKTFIASLYVKDCNHNTISQQPGVRLVPGTKLSYTIPRLKNAHLCEVGIIVHHTGEGLVDGRVVLENLSWEGAPDYQLDFSKERSEAGAITQWTFYRGFWRLEDRAYVGSGHETGETYTGSPEWTDYSVTAVVRSEIGDAHGVMARVQGARRSYVLALAGPGRIGLFKKVKGALVELSSAAYPWKMDADHALTLTVKGDRLQGAVDGTQLIDFVDGHEPYLSGQIGLMQGKGGRMVCTSVDMHPAQ